MILTEIIGRKLGTETVVRYFSDKNGQVEIDICKDSLKERGYTVFEAAVRFEEWDEQHIAAFVEAQAYRWMQEQKK